MAEEGVIGSTMEEAKRHPYLIVGGFVAVVALLWVLSSSGGSSKAQNFTFSYGPSDAQIAAGTAQQISTQQAQTAVSLANTQAATQTAVSQDYFGYLTNNSANLLAATINTNATAATISGQNNNTAVIASNNALTGLINTNQTTLADDMNGNATQLAITTSHDNTANYAQNTQAFINTTNQTTVQGAIGLGLVPQGYTRNG